MSYQAWSVVFGEQPSASKWNILGTNDAGFNDGTAIGDDAIISRHIADANVLPAHLSSEARWWEELARTTLGSAGDTVTVSGFTAKKYLMILFNGIATGGTLDTNFILQNDTGANYAQQYSVQHGAQTASTAQSSIAVESGAVISGGSTLNTLYMYNPSTADKVGWFRNVAQVDSLTAANVPRELDGQFMWNSSTQVTRFDWKNTGTGDFAIGTEVIVFGHD
jgi:hypothetical protein